MRYEVFAGDRLPKVGYGTWSIGGGTLPDRRRDRSSLAALRSALEIGYSHFDTAESYAAGHCEELLGQALLDSGVDRSRVFITSKVSPGHLAPGQVMKACDRSLRRIGTAYLDLYLIHWPNPLVPLRSTFKALNQLLKAGAVRHIGVSNFKLDLLKQAVELCDAPILTDQVPCSVVERSYVRNGVLAFCQSNGILLTAYSPLEQKRLRIGAGLRQVAAARSLTPEQVALAWLCSHPGIVTIPMSGNPDHQRDNFAAADVVLSPAEMAQLG